MGFGVLAVLAASFFLFHTLYVKTTKMVLSCEAAPTFRLVHISDLHGRTLFLNGRLSRLVNQHSPDRYFAISRGLGTVKLPIRLNCFPEISVYVVRNG
jgi:predicted MPP superfamily phosphohydrolase